MNTLPALAVDLHGDLKRTYSKVLTREPAFIVERSGWDIYEASLKSQP